MCDDQLSNTTRSLLSLCLLSAGEDLIVLVLHERSKSALRSLLILGQATLRHVVSFVVAHGCVAPGHLTRVALSTIDWLHG